LSSRNDEPIVVSFNFLRLGVHFNNQSVIFSNIIDEKRNKILNILFFNVLRLIIFNGSIVFFALSTVSVEFCN